MFKGVTVCKPLWEWDVGIRFLAIALGWHDPHEQRLCAFVLVQLLWKQGHSLECFRMEVVQIWLHSAASHMTLLPETAYYPADERKDSTWIRAHAVFWGGACPHLPSLH